VTHGFRAGLAVFDARPNDVVRVAHARELRQDLAGLRRWAAAHRVPCVEADDAELERLAGGSHHEGLCIVARPRRWLSASELGDLLERNRGCALALDRVRNPYNIGAMVRTTAFFGLDAALLGAPAPYPGLPPAAVRVAQGGAERVELARTTDLADTLARLRARGVRVFGADARGRTAATDARFARPSVLVVGNEREGLAERVRAQCDELVAVRGSGAVESLNVAVAAGILLAEMAAKRGRGS
jgi:TrmH RNA methyltransferase